MKIEYLSPPTLGPTHGWTHDRVLTDNIDITHEFQAIMLGVRRASVTEVLKPLQEAGLIRGVRGTITILDRNGLEAASCECYRAVTDEYDRLFPSPGSNKRWGA